MNEARATINTLANDLQVTLTIKDYNPNATSRLDVDLIITDLEGTNRPPTTEEENNMCIVCFGNYNQHNYLCTLTCGHSFHFACIDQWLRRNISCPICRESNL
ncbi:BnaA02g25660D [Brassica napus]|uniref:RING-type E3 ubiquitin transferase n=1 Tax=Brassica napus TaxID=3708 RepID=A0A078GQU4_BRANA|nr:BnaA02g25660D [Brassica napus]